MNNPGIIVVPAECPVILDELLSVDVAVGAVRSRYTSQEPRRLRREKQIRTAPLATRADDLHRHAFPACAALKRAAASPAVAVHSSRDLCDTDALPSVSVERSEPRLASYNGRPLDRHHPNRFRCTAPWSPGGPP